MAATSGAQLLPGDAVRKMRELLLPMTTILTPNIPEATLLLRDADIEYRTPSNLDDLKNLAKKLHSLGPKHILLKGGHIPLTRMYTKAQSEKEKETTVDILYPSSEQLQHDDSDFLIVESTYLTLPNTHGTGCSLASAVAANLALSRLSTAPSPPASGSALTAAINSAISYVNKGIKHSPALQKTLHSRGSGPINHFHSLLLPIAPRSLLTYILNHNLVQTPWHKFLQHPFPTAMACNTLPQSRFKAYLIQDYKYLTHFARTYALAAYKSHSLSHISVCAEIMKGIESEAQMHLSYCAEVFDLSKEEIEKSPESLACTAYSRYILNVGSSSDLLSLYIALAPCLIGYNLIAEAIASNPEYADKKEGNKYWRWVENYTSQEYRESVRNGKELIEAEVTRLGGVGRGKVEELVGVFVRCTELEIGFWNPREGEDVEDGE
jgi:hydroxymethylpyrimidine kinase/phosphomethylpyrimidine kinase